MAHSRPSEIMNRGDALRASRAAGSFIVELMSDRRVQAYQHAWSLAWATAKQKLDQFRERAKTPGAHVNWAAIHAAIDALPEGIRAGTQQFVREELKVKPNWVPLVADCLIQAFQISVYNAQHPDAPKQFGVPVYLAPDLPQGRLPRQEGLDIDRNVRWFYLTHIAVKPESVISLARDYQSSAARTNDSRSVVQNGIKQAEALLDLCAAQAVRLPKPK